MNYLELTFVDPAYNLACDEALLDLFESERPDDGLLRLWEPENYFVVLGHSNRSRAEAHSSACTRGGIPILRRVSGGGAVLQGPGCLNYSLIMDSQRHDVRNIEASFRYVLQRHRHVLGNLTRQEVFIDGISDLTIGGRKVSGNAQYRKSRYILVHGTFLNAFDLPMIDASLRLPHKQPSYRKNRPHLDFVANLSLDSARLRAALRASWAADTSFNTAPMEQVERLVQLRYGRAQWSNKF